MLLPLSTVDLLESLQGTLYPRFYPANQGRLRTSRTRVRSLAVRASRLLFAQLPRIADRTQGFGGEKLPEARKAQRAYQRAAARRSYFQVLLGRLQVEK